MLGMRTSTPWGFKRSSLVDQTAAALRAAIASGDLGESLPGGHQLARQLGVSRPTVRTALLRLASEGLLVVDQGRRSRVATKRPRRSSAPHPAVCVICPAAFEAPFLLEHPVLLEMHAEFASRGVGWEVIFEAKLAGASPGVRLQQLVVARPHVCWILFAAPEPVHRWFASAGVSTLVVGSCVPGLRLPSIDIDYGAVGWHAAGVVIKNRHRRVALILPAKPLPGDFATRDSFMRYVEQSAPDILVSEWTAPASIVQRRAAFDRMFMGTERPTALLSTRPELTFAALVRAHALGLRIPQDISVISRDTHAMFDSAMPELTRYSSTAMKLATRAVKIAMNLLAGRKVSVEPSLVMPTFVPGTTLGPCGDRYR
jgi:hypothetical protein